MIVDPTNPPFKIERVYFIYGTDPQAVRGRHAHKKLIQLAVCPIGSCVFDLDDGKEKQTVTLDDPKKGLLIGPMVWREMRDFSPDCVLVVLASRPYERDDYIYDYEEFTRAAQKQTNHQASLSPAPQAGGG